MIRNITVYLDTQQSHFHESIRCGFIVAEDDRGEETFHNDVLDSSEYHAIGELVDDIVGIFKVQRRRVLVAA
ncbi:MAG: hypothetical protein C0613_03360 [Desulfobulbaceae bacterium]|nr:MAG: hypothetical protein C0613_03360 [Desulfobulbaceae bacterium]